MLQVAIYGKFRQELPRLSMCSRACPGEAQRAKPERLPHKSLRCYALLFTRFLFESAHRADHNKKTGPGDPERSGIKNWSWEAGASSDVKNDGRRRTSRLRMTRGPVR